MKLLIIAVIRMVFNKNVVKSLLLILVLKESFAIIIKEGNIMRG